MKALFTIFGLSLALLSCAPKQEVVDPIVQKYSCQSVNSLTGDTFLTISRSFYNPGDLVLMGGSDGESSQKIIECQPFKN